MKPVTTMDMVTAHGEVMRLQSEIGALRMKLCLVESKLPPVHRRA
jgi:hypothetical protein